jgi:hypothetical protein
MFSPEKTLEPSRGIWDYIPALTFSQWTKIMTPVPFRAWTMKIQDDKWQ